MGTFTLKLKHKMNRLMYQCLGCGGINYFAPFYIIALARQRVKPTCAFCGGTKQWKKVKFTEKPDVEKNDLWMKLGLTDSHIKGLFPKNTWKDGVDVR